MRAMSEECEFTLDAVPACCLVAEVAQRPDHLDDALGVMAQDMAVCLEPAGIDGMVMPGRFTGMPEIDGLSLGGEALDVVWRSIGDGSDGNIGARLPERNLACELFRVSGMRAK